MKEKVDSRDVLIGLLKDKYEHEYARKKYFDDALGVPVTLSSFLVGGIYYVITDSANTQSLGIKSTFLILVMFLFVICIVTFWFLYKVYFTYTGLYTSFPDSEKLTDYYYSYKKHQIDCGKKDGSVELEQAICDDLKEQTIVWYKDANNKNLALNERRGQSFINAKIFLGIALLIGILIFSLTCINKSLTMAKQPTQQNPPPPPPAVRPDKASKPKAPSTTKK